MSEKQRGIWEMIGAMLISGTIGWFVLFSGEPVLSVVFWRCIIGSAALLVVCYVSGYLHRGAMTRKQCFLAMLAGVALVSNWLLLFSSYAHASIAIATAVYNVQPFILVFFGTMFFGERLTLTKTLWLCTAFAGVVLIIQSKSANTYGSGHYLYGIAQAFGAAFFYAIVAAITKALKGIPPHLVALVQVSVGIIMLAPFAILHGVPNGPQAWTAIATLGLIHTCLMYILLYGAIQKLSTVLIGSLGFIYPVAAVVVDYVALGHQLQLSQIVGIVVILFSAAGTTLGWSFGRNESCVSSKQC